MCYLGQLELTVIFLFFFFNFAPKYTWAHLPYIAVLKSVHRTATVCSSIRTFFRGSKLLTVAVLWTLAKTANRGSSMDTFRSSCA